MLIPKFLLDIDETIAISSYKLTDWCNELATNQPSISLSTSIASQLVIPFGFSLVSASKDTYSTARQ